MRVDLVIDGNYVLSRLVYVLYKNNILYGALFQSLENTIQNYRKLYPFSNIYLVSDSREASWRKKIIKSYKSNRKKDSGIDWKFVYETYGDFKNCLTNIKVLETDQAEGDDWISYVCEKSNEKGISTLIISNDYDIKQLIKYNLDPLYINIMSNEMYNKQKVFIPKNHQIFFDFVKKLPNDDIFNLNDNKEFIEFYENLINKYELNEVDCTKSLILKLICGDKSDNIDSVWTQIYKNGSKRGIGDKGAIKIYEKYLEEFGDIDLKDSELYENIADIICENRKISKNKISLIAENIAYNSKLIDLNLENIPKEIIKRMDKIYEDKNNLNI